tara:strand:+ start:434 stop:601 length:168 start_codon:yes stop_codon:yes gene_type:complete
MFGGVAERIGRVLVMERKSMNDYFHFWAKKGAPDIFRTHVDEGTWRTHVHRFTVA